MQKRSHRPERMSDLIHRELAQILRLESDDPRFANISITAVDVSKDMSVAKIYYVLLTSGDDDSVKKETRLALKEGKAYIRTVLASRIKWRIVPELIFVFDESIDYARHMTEILDNIDLKDE